MPLWTFYIGDGVMQTMLVAGDLYLHVNDGYLGNNSGHFTVAYSRLKKGSGK
jgi:hypothetical protein